MDRNEYQKKWVADRLWCVTANTDTRSKDNLMTEEVIDNTEQFCVVLSYTPGYNLNEERHYFSEHKRAEAFAKDVWQSIKDFDAFKGVEKITLNYYGINWQSWNALRGNHG